MRLFAETINLFPGLIFNGNISPGKNEAKAILLLLVPMYSVQNMLVVVNTSLFNPANIPPRELALHFI